MARQHPTTAQLAAAILADASPGQPITVSVARQRYGATRHVARGALEALVRRGELRRGAVRAAHGATVYSPPAPIKAVVGPSAAGEARPSAVRQPASARHSASAVSSGAPAVAAPSGANRNGAMPAPSTGGAAPAAVLLATARERIAGVGQAAAGGDRPAVGDGSRPSASTSNAPGLLTGLLTLAAANPGAAALGLAVALLYAPALLALGTPAAARRARDAAIAYAWLAAGAGSVVLELLLELSRPAPTFRAPRAPRRPATALAA